MGIEDFYVASRFDVDRDGKLNKNEREMAENAYSIGFENRWGPISYKGRPRNINPDTLRLEDITGIDSSLTHRENTRNSGCKTQKELFAKRKQEINEIGRDFMSKREKPIRVNHIKPLPEDYVENPLFQTQKSKIESGLKLARNLASLDLPKDTKQSPYEIPMFYNPNPKSKTQKELKDYQKHQNFSDLHEKKNFNHISREARMNKRELMRLSIISDEDNFLT